MRFIAFLLLLLSFTVSAQTVQTAFNGYANIQAITGSGPSFTFNINQFNGSPRFQNDGPWLANNVAIGDVIWYDCSRFVITAVNSSTMTTMNVTASVPAGDWSLGVSVPLTNTRCAVVRETTGTIPAIPPPADGNGGILSGIDNTL
ncbi:MAG: hypothetical protein JHC54_11985, partial [Acinetobacter sp.]|nr:hypothetical protein [Acinetobacter sp.]